MAEDSIFDPVRNRRHRPKYDVVLTEPGKAEESGALNVVSVKKDANGLILMEVFWHPTRSYRWVSSEHIKAAYHLRTKRKIADLGAYQYRR